MRTMNDPYSQHIDDLYREHFEQQITSDAPTHAAAAAASAPHAAAAAVAAARSARRVRFAMTTAERGIAIAKRVRQELGR